jgi:hypothetical protein
MILISLYLIVDFSFCRSYNFLDSVCRLDGMDVCKQCYRGFAALHAFRVAVAIELIAGRVISLARPRVDPSQAKLRPSGCFPNRFI